MAELSEMPFAGQTREPKEPRIRQGEGRMNLFAVARDDKNVMRPFVKIF